MRMAGITRGSQTTIHAWRMRAQLFRYILRGWAFVILATVAFEGFWNVGKYDWYLSSLFVLASVFSGTSLGDRGISVTNQDSSTVFVTFNDIAGNANVAETYDFVASNTLSSAWHGLLIGGVLVTLSLFWFWHRSRALLARNQLRGSVLATPQQLRSALARFNRFAARADRKRTLSSFKKKRKEQLRAFRHHFAERMAARALPPTQMEQYILRTEGAKKVAAMFCRKVALAQWQRNRPYSIAGFPYPRNSEMTHTLLVGSTGTGKSQVINDLIEQIRLRGDRALIFDKMGSFVSNFYDHKKDILLNPFDERSPAWSVFREAEHVPDFDMMAAAFIPASIATNEPFFLDAARIVFSTVAQQMWLKGVHSNEELHRALLRIEVNEMLKMVEGTIAGTVLAKENEKTVLSVRSTLATHLKCMGHLRDDARAFSLREWVHGNSAHAADPIPKEASGQADFVFMPAPGRDFEAVRNLISVWTEIVVANILSLKQSRDRKFWIILDEIGALHQIPSLVPVLTQARQFGACVVLGTQTVSQLNNIYGKEGASTITGNCRTKVLYSNSDPATTDWAAKTLGKAEIVELKENISFGSHEARDGVSINEHKEMRDIVLPSDISILPDLTAFLSFPQSMPVARVSVPYTGRKEIADRLIRRDTPAAFPTDTPDGETEETPVDTIPPHDDDAPFFPDLPDVDMGALPPATTTPNAILPTADVGKVYGHTVKEQFFQAQPFDAEAGVQSFAHDPQSKAPPALADQSQYYGVK